MIKLMRAIRRRSQGDAGVAILTVLLVMAVLAALSTTVTVMTVNNSQNSSRDRQAGSATAIADGGIAEAVNYLRGTAGAAGALIACPAPSCTNNDWGSSSAPHLVQVDALRRYLVYFELLSAPSPANKSAVFRVHSQGYAGAGPGARNVTVDLQYTPSSSFPIGIFTNYYDAGGTGNITNESVFSTGCVNQREHLGMTGTDKYYGIPTAVHTTGLITDSNGACSSSDSGNIHSAGFCNSQTLGGNNQDLRGDQDSKGGALSSGACYRYAPAPNPAGGTAIAAGQSGSYLENSSISTGTLTSQYGYRAGGLTPQELDTLRATAKVQGNYYTTTTYSNPTQNQAVLFFDLSSAGSTVDLSSITGYSRPVGIDSTNPSCTNRQVFIVVLNGNAKLQSNTIFVSQIFVPSPGPTNGTLSLAGGVNIVGTLYADKLTQQGTSNFQLDDCFLKNLNGNQYSLTLTNFREVDR